MRNGIFTLILLSIAPLSAAIAGSLNQMLFTPTGERINLDTFEAARDPYLVVTPKVLQTCGDLTCLHWKVVLKSGITEPSVHSHILFALEEWGSNANLEIEMDYLGVAPASPMPLVDGEFLISFSAPAGITFRPGQVSRTELKINPATGEIRAATIFLNGTLQPNLQYNLRTVLVHEMGIALGLGASGVRNAAMFPVQSASQADLPLQDDDLLWAAQNYAAENFADQVGSLKGRIVDGANNTPWVGAHLELIPVDQADYFVSTRDRTVAYAGTFSRDNGEFEFPSVTAGRYFLLAEPLSATAVARYLFDDYLQAFARADAFQPEFYDGAERESNHELLQSFSPQGIYYAATLVVEAQRETNNVVIYTNSADQNGDLLSAPGANYEELSSRFPKDVSHRKTKQLPAVSSGNDFGACAINEFAPINLGLEFTFLGCSLLLFFRRRSLLGRGRIRKS